MAANSTTKAIPLSKKVAGQISGHMVAQLYAQPNWWAKYKENSKANLWWSVYNNSTSRTGVRAIRIQAVLVGTFPEGSTVQNQLDPNAPEYTSFYALIRDLELMLNNIPETSYRIMLRNPRPHKRLTQSTTWQVTIWYKTKHFPEV